VMTAPAAAPASTTRLSEATVEATENRLAEPAVVPAQPNVDRHEEATPTYRAPPPQQTFTLPSDLVQIETSREKVGQRQTEAATPNGETAGARPRRPRPVEEPQPNEPLVQIETRH
jgi:hypothetical protein